MALLERTARVVEDTRASDANATVSTYTIAASRLEGKVRVSGAKNSVLRLLAASLLTSEPLQISNYPSGLLDAQLHVEMLEVLGKRCTRHRDVLVIEELSAPTPELRWSERSIRNTLLILGALTARTGAGSVPLPGGCKIGDRKHDLHVMVLERLGAEVNETETRLEAFAPKGLTGADIHLPIRSTGATENAILCGSLARGKTTIWNPHIRPEIMDLCAMLTAMGAKITVFGQERIEVVGVEGLSGTHHSVIADNMEALTWLIAASITGGDVEIQGFPTADLVVPLAHLRESGARYFEGPDGVIVRGSSCYPIEISTGAYPGINSDMQPLFAIFGAMSPGESRITDLRFPDRYLYVKELERMGLEVQRAGNELRIRGGMRLQGTTVTADDLRAGIALTLAGLVADGETIVREAWQVERGYDHFVEKLSALGGRISAQW